MILAVLLWSLVPVIFSLSGAEGFSSSVVFVLVFNFFGALLCLLGLLTVGDKWEVFSALWRFLRKRKRNLILLFLDGFFIVLSNLFFVWALSRGNEVFVLFVSEIWPVFVFLSLGVFISGFHGFSVKNIFPVSLTVLGLLVLVGGDWSEGAWNFDWVSLLLAFISALGQAGTVVVHQKVLSSFDVMGQSLSKNVILQFSRQVSAVMVSILVLIVGWFLGFRFFDNLEVNAGHVFVVSLVSGFLIVVSAVLHSRSLQLNADSSSVILWFLAPVFSGILLVAFVGSIVTLPLILGGAFILLGNLWLRMQH